MPYLLTPCPSLVARCLLLLLCIACSKGQLAREEEANQKAIFTSGITDYDVKWRLFYIETGDNVNKLDGLGRTTLSTAILLGHAGIIERLLELRADIQLKDATGLTPLKLAYHLKAVVKNRGLVITLHPDWEREWYLMAKKYTAQGNEALVTGLRDADRHYENFWDDTGYGGPSEGRQLERWLDRCMLDRLKEIIKILESKEPKKKRWWEH